MEKNVTGSADAHSRNPKPQTHPRRLHVGPRLHEVAVARVAAQTGRRACPGAVAAAAAFLSRRPDGRPPVIYVAASLRALRLLRPTIVLTPSTPASAGQQRHAVITFVIGGNGSG